MTIHKILTRTPDLRIAVVGDLILDNYINGTIDRISPEAPVPVLHVKSTKNNWGGAGNVVENLRGFGCQISFFYDQQNTVIKTRVMSGSHHILRMDEEDEPKWMRWDDLDIGLAYGIENNKFDCVVISDYGKGMISQEVADNIIQLCNTKGIPTVVDTKFQHNNFFGCTTLKCNSKEWSAVTKRGDFSDKHIFLNIGNINHLVITNGECGIQYFVNSERQIYGDTGSRKIDICDACGAGDTVTAVLAVMQALKQPIDDACELANIIAAEVCRHPGVYPITKQDLEQIKI
jgi:rfaE bifunctional protein kinase chain/domain